MSPGYTMIDNDTVIDRLPAIDGTALKVYLALARRAGAAKQCWPSVNTIGTDTGLCVRAVRRAIQQLSLLGLLEAIPQTGRSTLYRVTPPLQCTPANQGDTSDGSTPLPFNERTPLSSNERTPLSSDVPLITQKNNTKEKHKGNNTQRGQAAGEVEIPAGLDCDEFREAWGRWTAHRKKRGLTMLPETLKGQLSALAGLGIDGAVAEIGNSITKGWQSVCYSNGDAKNGHTHNGHFAGARRHSGARRGQRYANN
jgi:hypothetical protein